MDEDVLSLRERRGEERGRDRGRERTENVTQGVKLRLVNQERKRKTGIRQKNQRKD